MLSVSWLPVGMYSWFGYYESSLYLQTLVWYRCADYTYAPTVGVRTSKQVEVVGVEQLEAKEGENDLNGERAAIHKVSIEELRCVVKEKDPRVSDSFYLKYTTMRFFL